MKCKVFTSKNTDEWATPKAIYSQALELGMFDPCPLGGFIDGLAIEWGKINFVNPPYSQLRKWVNKAICEHRKNKDVIMLIPARTDTKAFLELWNYGSTFTFIIGRLKYNDTGTAPFPSMIVRLNGKNSVCKVIKREEITLIEEPETETINELKEINQ